MTLEVEVKIFEHSHIFLVDIETVLECPKEGDLITCTRHGCGHKGKVSRVGIPGRKSKEDDSSVNISTSPSDIDGQSSMFKKGKS